MTLEDFFTQTEIKDGITTANRVEELVNILSNENDPDGKNINDVTRQWSTVATTIAATVNQDCLDLFINLDGLRFLDRWLNDAQKLGSEKGESFVEESITAILSAIKNLHVDNRKSVASGIQRTVNSLLGHSNSAVQESAKALFDGWKEYDSESGVRENHVGEILEKPDDEKAFDEPTKDMASENHLKEDLGTTQVHEGAMEVQKIGSSEKLGDCNTPPLVGKGAEPKENLEISKGRNEVDKSESPNPEATNQDKEDEPKTIPHSNEDAEEDDYDEVEHGSPTDSEIYQELVRKRSEMATNLEKEDEPKTNHHSNEDDEEDDNDEVEHESPTDSEIYQGLVRKRSAIEDLECGMVDPLEVARQVAMEVEREMDCREASSTSSDKRPDSPGSVKQNQPVNSPPKEVQNGSGFSTGAPMEEAENVVGEQENVATMVADEPNKANQEEEKGFCGFDLNEEVCNDETEHDLLNPVSNPVSLVSASRAAAATGSPSAPLHFEGTFGFKGPTATSAFRIASPRWSTEGGANSNSKQRLDFLDFDLNVAEEEKTAEPGNYQIPFSSAGESSLEASSRRSERLDLDLNLVSDGGDVPPLGRLFHRNGLHSPSPSSSSSTMQPMLRNIDLNDQPSFLNDSLNRERPFFNRSNQNPNPRADDSAISIMGTRVEVSREDFVMQNGRTMDPTPDLSLSTAGGMLGIGTSFPYTHSPIYGYTPGPGSTIPFTYGPAGPIPYMVDSTGTHVVPQILGSTSAHPHVFTQQPFFMSSAPSGSNGAGQSGHSFDLNSGLLMEGGSRETSGLRQFLNPVQVNMQPSSSVGAGKRKEPDGGWDPYPFNYKQHQSSPWK